MSLTTLPPAVLEEAPVLALLAVQLQEEMHSPSATWAGEISAASRNRGWTSEAASSPSTLRTAPMREQAPAQLEEASIRIPAPGVVVVDPKRRRGMVGSLDPRVALREMILQQEAQSHQLLGVAL